jgi:DNA mismatch endonuclease (patch repair protein)
MDRISRKRRSANMAAIRGKDTGPELTVRRFLHASGFRFRLHHPGLPSKPDVVLPRYRSVVLINGCFWHVHNCPLGQVKPKTNAAFWKSKRQRTVERDAEKLTALTELGWRVRVLWECQIKDGSFADGLCDWVRAGSTITELARSIRKG